MEIYTHIPFSLNRDYGKQLNKFMRFLGEDDWAVIMDYDAMFTHNSWYAQVHNAAKEGDALMTCVTNRTAMKEQKIGVDENNHDMKFHYEVGKKRYEEYNNVVKDFKCSGLLSGYVMIFPKRLWSAIGGVSEGSQLGIDNEIHRKAMAKGYPVKILLGVYAYHAYFRL